jgi:hypothetical protein
MAHGVGGASHSHQVLGAWSTRNQGRTGQGASAAVFLPAQEPYDLESDEESEAEVTHRETLEATNRAAMRILANNRSVCITTAARMARDTTTAEAAPSWTGIGANYAAWVRALKQDPMSPEAAINEEAPKRAYLAVMYGAKHLSVLHHLHWWKAPDGGRSRFDGCIVAFEGEVRDAHGLPLLWKFEEQEELLLQRCQLPASALHHASLFYREGNKNNQFHTCWTPPPQKMAWRDRRDMLPPHPHSSGIGPHVSGLPVHGDSVPLNNPAHVESRGGRAAPPPAFL